MLNLEAEQSLLGAILLTSKLGEASGLQPSDFGDRRHVKIFTAMRNLHDLGEPVDIAGLAPHLNGDVSYAVDLASMCIGTSNVQYYIKIIKELSFKRNIYSFCIKNCKDHATSADEVHERLSKLLKTYDSSGKNHRESKLSDDVWAYVQSTNGIFLSTEVHGALHISTKEDKKNAAMILKRLSDKGLIEKAGHKNGMWRLIDQTEDRIDIANASEDIFPVFLPLGLDEFVHIYPTNVIVVAGQSNAGKSVFCMEIALRNYKNHKVTYFSSEMDGTELRMRLKHAGEDIDEANQGIKWLNQSMDWWDKIDPEGINIIDYMEITEEHYKIGGWITKCRNKLTKGIVIIALQKPSNRAEGTGGRVTRDKARLYVSLDFNRAEIVKAKNWQDTVRNLDPNGLVCEFEINRGRLNKTTVWDWPPQTTTPINKYQQR